MAPNSVFDEYFGEKMKDFYENKLYSDVTIKITERVPAVDPDSPSSDSTVTHSKVIKCHKLVLHINSPYFEEALQKQGCAIDEFEMEVNEGQGRYIEMLLSCFYDVGVASSLNLIDLMCLLEVSIIYARDHYQKLIADLIEKLDPDFDSATFGLQKLHSFEKSAYTNVTEDLKSSLKKKFSTFLAKYFAPIEENQEKHETFLCLEYSSLWYMLQGNEPIAASENSIIILISEWLDYQICRQTPDKIEGLLNTVRVKYLDGMLVHSLGHNHRVFNKWIGYKDWIFNSFKYFITSPKENKQATESDEVLCRNIPNGINAWFHSKKNTEQELGAIRWKVHMTTVDKGKRLEPTRHLLIHDGMKFSPKSITITPIEGNDKKFNMSLQITGSFPMNGIRFVVGIVPANNEYHILKKHFCSPFAKAFLKWTDPITTETNSKDFDYWTISANLVEIANEYGLYVFLLPLTDAEYEILDGSGFGPKCGHGSGNLRRVVGAHICLCNRVSIHTSAAHKIQLNESCNFSV